MSSSDVRSGSSSTILYAIRLATRIESYVNFLLGPSAGAVRGLALPGTPDFGGETPAKTLLRNAAASLRRKLVEQVCVAIPLMGSSHVRPSHY